MEGLLNFIWARIKDLYAWVKKDYKRLLICILCIVCAVLYIKTNNIKHKYEKYYQRSTDTLSVYKDKMGELYKMNNTYILSERELKRENEELYNEIKNLKDNPVVIVKTKLSVVRDTIVMISENTQEIKKDDDIIYKNNFIFKDEWMDLQGENIFSTKSKEFSTTLNKFGMTCDLTTSLIEVDDKLYFVSKSTNPYVKINTIDGYVISPDNAKVLKNHFDDKWVLSFGIGPTVTVQNQVLKVVPGLQLTLGYKILGF